MNAKRLTGEEITALLDGNTFTFVVYGKDASLTGTSTWDAERGVAYGDYSVDHQASETWRRRWWVEGDRKCSQSQDKPAHCNTIYSDGERYFDVGGGGTVVSVSTPVR